MLNQLDNIKYKAFCFKINNALSYADAFRIRYKIIQQLDNNHKTYIYEHTQKHILVFNKHYVETIMKTYDLSEHKAKQFILIYKETQIIHIDE